MTDELDAYLEWGGTKWRHALQVGLAWLGDPAGLRVLDVGTRRGRMATWFAERGADVVGLDLSDESFDEARRFAAEHGALERLRFETYSGRPADLPGGFDVVFAKSVIVLMDISEAVEGLAHALRPAGRLLLVENARGPMPVHLLRMLRRRSLRPHGASYFSRATVDVFRRRFAIEIEEWSTPAVVIGARKAASQAVDEP